MKILNNKIIVLFTAIILNDCGGDNIKIIQYNNVLSYDYVLRPDSSKVYLQSLSDILKWGDNKFVIVDGKMKQVFVTDNNFIIVDSISLKEKEFLFHSNKYSAGIRNNLLYIVDNTYKIKILNLDTKNIDVLDNKINPFLLGSYVGNIEFINDTTLIFSSECIQIPPKIDTLIVGGEYNLNGKMLTLFAVPVIDLDYNSEFTQSNQSSEECFVTYYKEKIYISFKASRKAVVFNLYGKILGVYTLEVDNKYWKEPHMESRGFYTHPVTTNKLIITDDKIFQIVKKDGKISPSVMVYDLSFSPVEKYEIRSINNVEGYRLGLILSDDELIIQNRMQPIFYSVTK